MANEDSATSADSRIAIGEALYGLVTLAVGAFTVDMFLNVPFTADFSQWYAPTTAFALLTVVALAGWGFYHSLGGEPVWKVEME